MKRNRKMKGSANLCENKMSQKKKIIALYMYIHFKQSKRNTYTFKWNTEQFVIKYDTESILQRK